VVHTAQVLPFWSKDLGRSAKPVVFPMRLLGVAISATDVDDQDRQSPFQISCLFLSLGFNEMKGWAGLDVFCAGRCPNLTEVHSTSIRRPGSYSARFISIQSSQYLSKDPVINMYFWVSMTNGSIFLEEILNVIGKARMLLRILFRNHEVNNLVLCPTLSSHVSGEHFAGLSRLSMWDQRPGL
jgi:hypothetical protein